MRRGSRLREFPKTLRFKNWVTQHRARDEMTKKPARKVMEVSKPQVVERTLPKSVIRATLVLVPRCIAPPHSWSSRHIALKKCPFFQFFSCCAMYFPARCYLCIACPSLILVCGARVYRRVSDVRPVMLCSPSSGIASVLQALEGHLATSHLPCHTHTRVHELLAQGSNCCRLMRMVFANMFVSFSCWYSLYHFPVARNRRQPAGLVNRGNTCFLNAILQALRSSPRFKSFLLAHPSLHKPSLVPSSSSSRRRGGGSNTFPSAAFNAVGPNDTFLFQVLKECLVDEKDNANVILNEIHEAMQKQQPAGMFVPLQQQVQIFTRSI